MKNYFKIVVLFLFFTNSAFAQNTIEGLVLDDRNDPALFVTVALYNSVDQSLITGVATDIDGKFSIKDIADGAYNLKVTLIGSKDYIAPVNFPKDNGKVLDVQLEQDVAVLTEVVVTGKVPLFVQKSDRLVVNIENNVIGLTTNLLDVMKRIPGMLVVNDQLRMAGQTNVTILINGKTTKYMDVQSLLRDMPGDNVKSVEVIHQPGAEFDAEGTGAVINVILKKNNLYGTNGRISGGYERGTVQGYNSSLSLSHYQGNLNISGNIGLSRYVKYRGLTIQRDVNGDTYNQETFDPSNPLSFHTNLGLDYEMNDNHRFGFDGRYNKSNLDKIVENTTKIDFQSESETDLDVRSNNLVDNQWDLIALNPNYTFTIDTAGQKLDFDVNYAKFSNNGNTIQQSQEFNVQDFIAGREYETTGNTEIWSSRLDYVKPISKNLKLQFGGKFSAASLDNNLQSFLEDEETGKFMNDPTQTNRFIYTEDIAAGYTKLSFNKAKWSGTVGLRYENSQAEGNSVTLDSVVTRNISKLFPSFSLQRKISSVLDASVAYSYRIERPNYAALNPFVYYWDPFTSEQGNPLLQPATAHSMKFNLAYEKQPFFNVEYKIINDPMVEVTEQNDETGEAYTTTVNLESLNTFNTSFYFPLDFIPGVSGGYGGILANHVDYNSTYLGEQFNRSKWSYGAVLEAHFKLPWDINSEVTAYYDSGSQEGILDAEWLYGIHLGLSKKFLDGNAKFSVRVEDLFARYYHADIQFANMNGNVVSKWDAPFLRVGFTYKFGNQHTKKKEKWEGSGAKEIKRAQK